MSEEEKYKEIFRLGTDRLLKELQKNPDDLANYDILLKKYNAVLKDKVHLQQELSKYKELYTKALDNTIKSDRKLMKYKEANKKAIEYIKTYSKLDTNSRRPEMIKIIFNEEERELLKILEEVENEN